MNWQKTNWDDVNTWPKGRFLAAVQGGDDTWDYAVLTIDENGILQCDGDVWGAWEAEDIEWIAVIEAPIAAA